MYEIVGRIMTITKVSDKASYVVIKKKIRGKDTPIAIETFGLWNEKMKELKLNINDKIVGKLYIKSNLYNGKWYTNLYFRDIKKYEEKPKEVKPELNLFVEPKDDDDWHGHIIDEETGEIIL